MKYQGKYRIPSARLPGWDYRNMGAYFITICTQNREHFFGEIKNGNMKLTTAGIIAKGCWYEIDRLYPSVELGAFVVMPNHIHGVLILHDETVETIHRIISNTNGFKMDALSDDAFPVDAFPVDAFPVETLQCNVSTNPNPNPDSDTNPNSDTNKNEYFSKISPKSKSVSRIVQQYKSACTYHIRESNSEINFAWQERFYDHIIKNDASFERISLYILENEKNWKEDKFFNPE